MGAGSAQRKGWLWQQGLKVCRESRDGKTSDNNYSEISKEIITSNLSIVNIYNSKMRSASGPCFNSRIKFYDNMRL